LISSHLIPSRIRYFYNKFLSFRFIKIKALSLPISVTHSGDRIRRFLWLPVASFKKVFERPFVASPEKVSEK